LRTTELTKKDAKRTKNGHWFNEAVVVKVTDSSFAFRLIVSTGVARDLSLGAPTFPVFHPGARADRSSALPGGGERIPQTRD
jgi:hypothetical protein